MASTAFLRSPSLRWAAGGWAFFIAENVILSENRTFLIENLGDGGYHNVYGFFSTAAVVSIGYAYVRKVRNVAPLLWTVATPLPSRVASWMILSLGLSMASQTLPKFQIPVAYTANTDEAPDKKEENPKPAPSSSFQVRCPFDFTDPKQHGGQLYGLERISRHPGLWSMALVGIGHACLVPSLPQRVWLIMPTLLALVGGAHTDSRYRRGMGGTLEADYDDKTSNVPFAAMLTRVGGWQELATEVKPINALLATGVAALWAFKRSGPIPAAVRKVAATVTK
jgi:uncharacterized membrane protein